MQAIVDPVYFKRTVRMSPGVVGSVGDTINGVRLKQSAPDMAMRYDGTFSAQNRLQGTYIQDGDKGGMNARVYEEPLMRNGFKHAHGWQYQDLRAPDTLHEPLLAPTERYSWRNQIATIYEAKRTGDMFLPLPGPYLPTSLPRGGQVPRVVQTNSAEYKEVAGGINAGSLYRSDNPDEALNDLQPPNKQSMYIVCRDKTGKVTSIRPR